MTFSHMTDNHMTRYDIRYIALRCVQQRERSASARYTDSLLYFFRIKVGTGKMGARRALALLNAPPMSSIHHKDHMTYCDFLFLLTHNFDKKRKFFIGTNLQKSKASEELQTRNMKSYLQKGPEKQTARRYDRKCCQNTLERLFYQKP